MVKNGLLSATMLVACAVTQVAFTNAQAEPLPVETIPNVATLPATYSKDWLFVHDENFNSLLDGRVILMDLSQDNHNYKGAMGAGMFASFLQSSTRPEMYVAETYYSRGSRGDRVDVLTIYDTENLSPIEEIALPDGKRSMSVAQKGSLQLTGNEKFLLVFNFTPAASVSIIDVETRKIMSDIQIPGCSLIYPLGAQGFSTLCGNGTMASFSVNDAGIAKRGASTEAFNNIDDNPLFMKSVTVGGITYFPSFGGALQAVDMKSDTPKPLNSWTFVDTDKSTTGWRPSGWQVIAANDKDGYVYTLMRENAAPGDHKYGGSEVWVLDPVKKEIVRRITLNAPAISIELTAGETPYLAAANEHSTLDIYTAATGTYLRTITVGMAANPFLLHAVK
ncbi:amine dehydrogenase large subunit [Kordiimonas pumila]|uniref:Amine dehydrogenase large subunit n=1 Tax=Kordiimonas pumila TaxID=2161677 RepID=A0ABV7D5V6_9PROT|nr:amine dehydrogenase large subunit [Kordiimonas pumila]